jgi:hypothetical protein
LNLTAEQVAGLAPDASSLKAGRGLAGERRWTGLGQSERAVWGLCQGSGAKPYQTQVDLSVPAFRCSCPSRKFPCKHALGLLFLAAEAPATIPSGEPPDWVAQWLASREDRTERAQQSNAQRTAPDPEARARREARREERVTAGVEELERWLHDLARQGLAQARQRSYGFWDEQAARLVDAQAPGLAGRVRGLGGVAASGREAWAEALLEDAGLLELLLIAYRRIATLPEPLQVDVRTLVGWTIAQEDVLRGPAVRDRWAVLGRSIEEEERLRVQRVWLQATQTSRQALILTFAPAGRPLDLSLVPGTVVDATLAFYPSASPLRALMVEQHSAPEPLDSLPGLGVADALEQRAQRLASQPWLWRSPSCLQDVVPVNRAGTWLVAEPDGRTIELSCEDRLGWRLAGLSGGRPVALFGEWRRERLRPISACAEGRFVSL